MAIVRTLTLCAAAACAVALTPSASGAAIYDLNSDWSDSSNPNGVWTLRQGATPLTSVGAWFGFPGSGQPAWTSGNVSGGFLPAFLKATDFGFNEPGCGPTCDWQPGDVVAHTQDNANGAAYGIANVLFTTPFAGTADISGLTWAGRAFGRTQAWDLLVNGMSVAGGLLPGSDTNGRAAPDVFGLNDVALAAGDQVELRLFQVSDNTLGDFVGLNVHVDLTAAGGPVPEPATWALMILGFASVGAAMRRSRRPLIA